MVAAGGNIIVDVSTFFWTDQHIRIRWSVQDPACTVEGVSTDTPGWLAFRPSEPGLSFMNFANGTANDALLLIAAPQQG